MGQLHEVIERLDVAAYVIPTETPESDGTFEWEATTLVAVHVTAAGVRGFGYTYADVATAKFIDAHLKAIVVGRDATSPEACWAAMIRAVRNLGRRGVAATAISAVDAALWDLKCKLAGLPLGSDKFAMPCRSTAAAASRRTRSNNCSGSSPVGRRSRFRA